MRTRGSVHTYVCDRSWDIMETSFPTNIKNLTIPNQHGYVHIIHVRSCLLCKWVIIIQYNTCHGVTVPETNIAHENPHLSCKIPSKWWMFHELLLVYRSVSINMSHVLTPRPRSLNRTTSRQSHVSNLQAMQGLEGWAAFGNSTRDREGRGFFLLRYLGGTVDVFYRLGRWKMMKF